MRELAMSHCTASDLDVEGTESAKRVICCDTVCLVNTVSMQTDRRGRSGSYRACVEIIYPGPVLFNHLLTSGAN